MDGDWTDAKEWATWMNHFKINFCSHTGSNKIHNSGSFVLFFTTNETNNNAKLIKSRGVINDKRKKYDFVQFSFHLNSIHVWSELILLVESKKKKKSPPLPKWQASQLERNGVHGVTICVYPGQDAENINFAKTNCEYVCVSLHMFVCAFVCVWVN